MTSEIVEIRIKRLRTPNKDSIPEVIERWASREGLSIPGAVLHLLATHPTMKAFLAEIRNPGRATT